MPLKRRVSKVRPHYSETIERLIDFLPIDFSEDTKDDLLGVVYFNEFPELPDEVRERAMSILSNWSISNASKTPNPQR